MGENAKAFYCDECGDRRLFFQDSEWSPYKCSICGNDKPQKSEPSRKEPRRRRPVFLIIALLSLGIGIILAIYFATKHKSQQLVHNAEPTNEEVATAAWLMAQKAIPLALKAPKSAEFPSEHLSSSRLPDIADRLGKKIRRWSATGPVDAQNSFGIFLRSWWEILVVRRDGDDKFYPAAIWLDSEIVYVWDEYYSSTGDAKPVRVRSER